MSTETIFESVEWTSADVAENNTKSAKCQNSKSLFSQTCSRWL